MFILFFFQAEDGIRDLYVTGVQTCALPILPPEEREEMQRRSQVQLAMLPASRYPRLIECAAPMTTCDEPDFHYRFGIGLFIDGVKAAAQHNSGQGHCGPDSSGRATGDTRSE